MSQSSQVTKVRVRRRRRILRADRRRAQLRRALGGIAVSGLIVIAGWAAVYQHGGWSAGDARSVANVASPSMPAGGSTAPSDADAHDHGNAAAASVAASETRTSDAQMRGAEHTRSTARSDNFTIPQSLRPELACNSNFAPEEPDTTLAGSLNGDAVDVRHDQRADGAVVSGAGEDGGVAIVALEFDGPTGPVASTGPYFGAPKARLVNYTGLSGNPFGSSPPATGAALVLNDPLGGGGLGGAGLARGVPAVPATTGASMSGPSTTADPGAPDITASAEPSSTGNNPLSPVVVSDGDVLGGSDTLVGGLILEGTGLLIPGHSPGILTVDQGDYEMTGGVLQIEIEGRDPGTGYDQIVVLEPGVAELSGGTIEFLFHQDFEPVAGDRFDFLVAPSGVIDDVLFGIDEVEVAVIGLDPLLDFFIDTSDRTRLTLALFALPQLSSAGQSIGLTQANNAQGGTAQAPAPATALLLLVGLTGLHLRRRRRP